MQYFEMTVTHPLWDGTLLCNPIQFRLTHLHLCLPRTCVWGVRGSAL